jgi:hypothetical protein
MYCRTEQDKCSKRRRKERELNKSYYLLLWTIFSEDDDYEANMADCYCGVFVLLRRSLWDGIRFHDPNATRTAAEPN